MFHFVGSPATSAPVVAHVSHCASAGTGAPDRVLGAPALPEKRHDAAVFGRSSGTGYHGDVASQDLGELLSAVNARLRRTVGDEPLPSRGEAGEPQLQSMRTAVLECVAALDQIQSTLKLEMERRDGLEVEVGDIQAALAQALADLAGTQAGERYALHLAQHDSLTSLPNRAFFLERLDTELASLRMRRQSLAVLYLDLDEFKPVNDRYGHGTGDELLRIVGIRLSRSVRIDDMVCRLGGDEFACLLVDVQGRAQLGALAQKLIDTVAAPLQVGKRKLVVRPSIGIALSPEHGTSSEDLLRRADEAMYHAKRQRTGYAFCETIPLG